MEFERMKREATKLNVVIDKIKNNNTQGYKWYAVRNKKRFLIEVGGRNYKDKLGIKVYIPKFEKGKYLVHQNGYTNSTYALTNTGLIEYPTFSSVHFLKNDEFLQFIDNTDFKTYSPKIEEKEIKVIETYLTAEL